MPPKGDRNTALIHVSFPEGLDGSFLLRCKAIAGISLPTSGRPLIGISFVTDRLLKALLEKLQRSFQESILVLGDLLQWRNVKLEHPTYDELHCKTEALTLGDKWVDQNKKIIRNLGERFVRWQMLINNTDLTDEVRKIYAVYSDPSEKGIRLREVIEETASKFADRYCSGGEGMDGVEHLPITDAEERVRIKESSVEYIKEELAYLIAYAIKYRVDYFLYPGDEKDFPAFTEARKIFLVDENKNLLQWLKVTFRVLKPRERKTSDIVPSNVAEGSSGDSHDSGSGRVSPEKMSDRELVAVREQLRRLEEGMSAIYGLLVALTANPSLVARTSFPKAIPDTLAGALPRSFPGASFFGSEVSEKPGLDEKSLDGGDDGLGERSLSTSHLPDPRSGH